MSDVTEGTPADGASASDAPAVRPSAVRPSTFDSAAFLTVAAMLRTALGFAFTVLAVQRLGAASFGKYSLVSAFAVAFLFSYSGIFPVITSRLVETRGEADATRGRAQAALVTGAAFICVPGGLLLLAAGLIGRLALGAQSELAPVVTACTLIAICQLASQLGVAVLEGFGRMRTAAVLAMGGIALLTGGLVLAAITRHPVTLPGFLWASCVAYLAEALVVALFTVLVVRPLPFAQAKGAGQVRRLLREGFHLQAAKVIALTIEPINKAILNAHVGPASIAVYDLANKAATSLQAVFAAYSRLFLQISRGAVDERLASLRRVADYSWAMFLYAAAFVASLVIVPAAGWLHLDRSELSAGFILCAAMNWLIIVATPAYLSLIGFGEYRFILRNQTILAVSSAVGGLLLVPWIGLPGAFVGALAATVLNVVLIERRFGELMPGHHSSWRIARSMAGRLLPGAALLVLPAIVLPMIGDQLGYWLAASAVGCAVVALAWREPLVPVLMQMVKPRLARSS